MQKTTAISIPALALALGLSAPALAQSVTATTDLNVRAGPGPQYPVVGVIAAGEGAELNGCLENSKWCSLATAGGEGWVYADYVSADFGGNAVVLSERPADSGVAVVEPPATSEGAGAGAVAGGLTGAIAGAVAGGPVGAAVGGAAGIVGGAATGSLIDPPNEVRDYVTTNELDPVYLDGEVVVGAGLPETVELHEVPDYEYRYVYVNGQPVLVDATSRRVVYIVR
ncbi:MAG TPA: DUF1236 domain-containing protein [Aquamicrobium sp.]|jgi:uncharacterized protein YraI|nr:DUF1236 domain-containing protein [Aquamicrobium sp.]